MKTWYVLRTHARAERHASQILEEKGLRVFFPRLRVRTARRSGEGMWAHEPLFTGYVFCELDINTEDWLIARSAPGVSYILGQNSGTQRVPAPVPTSLIQQVAQRVERENGLRANRNFQAGDQLLVLGGPFRGLDVMFDRRLRPAGRARVLLTMLHQLVQVDLSLEDLQRRA